MGADKMNPEEDTLCFCDEFIQNLVAESRLHLFSNPKIGIIMELPSHVLLNIIEVEVLHQQMWSIL